MYRKFVMDQVISTDQVKDFVFVFNFVLRITAEVVIFTYI